jgi:MFS family permease
VLSVDDMIRESGGFGKWHIYTFILCILSGCMSTTFIYTMPFLQKVPTLICTDGKGIERFCDTDAICHDGALDPHANWKVDYDSPDSTHNWVTQMELYCESKFKIGLLGSMYFLGFVLSGIILLLVDVYGRKKLSIAGTFFSMFCVFGLYF